MKNKKFYAIFLKNCGFQRQSLWAHSEECEILALNLFNLYRQAHF